MRWMVTVPIAGYAYLEVQADSEQQAIDKALEEVCADDFVEWYAVQDVVTGNVFHGPLNSAEATPIEEDVT